MAGKLTVQEHANLNHLLYMASDAAHAAACECFRDAKPLTGAEQYALAEKIADRGLEFGPDNDGYTDAERQFMIDAAGEQYGRDGECEVDDGAVVSWGDDPGAYVQAWVWVQFPECEKCEEHHLPGRCPVCPRCDEPADEARPDRLCAECAKAVTHA